MKNYLRYEETTSKIFRDTTTRENFPPQLGRQQIKLVFHDSLPNVTRLQNVS